MSELDRLGWVVTDWFDIQGSTVGVRTTSQAFGEWLRHALAAHVVDGSDLDDDDAQYSVVVGEGPGDGGAKRYGLLYDGIWNLVRTLDAGALARSLLNELDARTASTREDAVFVQAALLRLGERTALIPATLVQPCSSTWRRLATRMDVGLPEGMTVAVDPATGRLVRPEPELRIASTWEADLAERFPVAAAPGTRTVVDTVLLSAADPGPLVRPAPRAAAVMYFARCVSNPATMGAATVRALGAMAAGAECFEVNYASPHQAVDVFQAVVERRHYSEDRTEVTPDALVAAQDADLGSGVPDEMSQTR